MKTYDLIKKILEENQQMRSDDELLKWTIWEMEGSVKNGCMYYSDFKNATNTETIRRARQLVQADHPELEPTEIVKNLRRKKQAEKGTFPYRAKIESRPQYEFNPVTQRYEIQ